jgi:hypothetical protein
MIEKGEFSSRGTYLLSTNSPAVVMPVGLN